MTAFLPLDAGAPLPPSPAFLVPSSEPAGHVKRVIKAVLKARRIAVVCGAGISVQAGIPDFRSSEGLFQSIKKDHPMLSSGKDLFDASVFNSENTTSLFCQMIAQLSQLSDAAQPTAFHQFLRVLDDRRRLLRVYTQNIDALEEKSGLTFGVPELDIKRNKPRSSKVKPLAQELEPAEVSPIKMPRLHEPLTNRLPSPPIETPKCIPLHGTLQLMHCVTCTHSYPLRDYIASLQVGTPPSCPQCTALEETRQLVGKRSRGVGKLRPSVVLYNEDHKDGEEVGNVVRKDLMGSCKGKGRAGADLLLVVGTSLRVPGTKRIVREFSKAVRSRHAAMNAPSDELATGAHGLVMPTPSPRRSLAEDEETPVRTIYLNLDFPVPTREWEGVFDVWIRGDAQTFAKMVHEELEKEEQAKDAAKERKRKREEAAKESARLAEEQEVITRLEVPSSSKKGKNLKEQVHRVPHSGATNRIQPTKKRKVGNSLLSPTSAPPNKAGQKKGKGKGKIPASRGRHVHMSLPTPPTSRDDSTRLTIKLPPLHKRLVVSTVTSPVPLPGPFSSPLSSPPLSTCDSLPSVPKASTSNVMTPLSSPLSTPPLSNCGDPSPYEFPYDMSRLSSTLSQISSPPSSPPRSIQPPSPSRPIWTSSGIINFPSPSPSMSSSPSPSPSKKRKLSSLPSPAGKFMGSRPGMRSNYRYGSRTVDAEVDRFDETGSSPSESRLPESYMRSRPGLTARRRVTT